MKFISVPEKHLAKAIAQSFKELLSTKHLYQSVDISKDFVRKEVESMEFQRDLELLVIKRATLYWNISLDPQPPHHSPSGTSVSLSNIETFCHVCRLRKPFSAFAANSREWYIIIPTIEDGDDILKSSAFKEVLTVLRALAANDDRIIEYFRSVSQGQQRKGGGSVQFDIDERLAKRINLADFASEIELKCWDKLAKLSWLPFEEAREFARSLGLIGEADWRSYCNGLFHEKNKLPADIPATPAKVYKINGWKGWDDWLGKEQVVFLPFTQARSFVQSIGIKSESEWRKFCRGKLSDKGAFPANIPRTPNEVYANKGWAGWADWLGTKRSRGGEAMNKKI